MTTNDDDDLLLPSAKNRLRRFGTVIPLIRPSTFSATCCVGETWNHTCRPCRFDFYRKTSPQHFA